MTSAPLPTAGLEDLIVSTSEICYIDGQAGRLLYRGYDIDDLVAHSTFEEVTYLLWYGAFPSRKELAAHVNALRAARRLPSRLRLPLRALPRKSAPMDALRSAVSLLATLDPDASDNSREATVRKAIRLTAQMPTIVALWERLRHGRAPVPPHPTCSLAADFLFMLTGKKPDPSAARAFDAALILHADHELNASTFAARVTAATLSDLHSAVIAAIGALKGPLHGGANEQVMRMVEEIGSPEGAEAWVQKALEEKRRVPGFGHRVYRVEDPCAKHLRRLAEDLTRRAGDDQTLETLETIAQVMKQEKALCPNVDYYSGALYSALGIPIDLFTPIFAMSRIAGWAAHILEQYADNRLIRPRAQYVGPSYRPYPASHGRSGGKVATGAKHPPPDDKPRSFSP